MEQSNRFPFLSFLSLDPIALADYVEYLPYANPTETMLIQVEIEDVVIHPRKNQFLKPWIN